MQNSSFAMPGLLGNPDSGPESWGMRILAAAWLVLLLAGCQQQRVSVEPAPAPPSPPPPPPAARPVEVPAPPPPTRGEVTNPFLRQGPKERNVVILALADSPSGKGVTPEFRSGTEEVFLRLGLEGVDESATLRTLWTPAGQSPIVDSAMVGGQEEVFSIARPEPGEYTVVVELDGEPVARTNFTVGSAAPAPATDEPPRPRPAAGDSPLDYAVLTEDYQEGEPSDRFPQSSVGIYLIIGTSKLPPGTPIKTVWTATSVPELRPGELVDASEVSSPADQEEDCLFTFAPPEDGFLAGEYAVQVYVGKRPVETIPFEIVP